MHMKCSSDLSRVHFPMELLELPREHVNIEILEGGRTALVAQHLKHVGEFLSLLRVLASWHRRVVSCARAWTVGCMGPAIITCRRNHNQHQIHQLCNFLLTRLRRLLLRARRRVVAGPRVDSAAQLRIRWSAGRSRWAQLTVLVAFGLRLLTHRPCLGAGWRRWCVLVALGQSGWCTSHGSGRSGGSVSEDGNCEFILLFKTKKVKKVNKKN